MTTYRLPSDLQADLEWYWCRADSDLGVHSNMSGIIARANLLTHGKREKKAEEDRPSGIRLALAERPKRSDARDEALRLYCLFGPPKLDHNATSDPMPERAERARSRLIRIHERVMRLRESPNGVEHQRVLYWVYGDTKQAIMADELVRIAKYAKTKVRANEMLSAASRAYEACHEAEVANRKAERREKFRAMLGAA